MQPDEYRRLSAACQAMAAQSSNRLPDKVRWSKLAQRSSDLANETAATRLIFGTYQQVKAARKWPERTQNTRA
jgi:hypothetical protein